MSFIPENNCYLFSHFGLQKYKCITEKSKTASFLIFSLIFSSVVKFFKNVERNVYEDIMKNHVGISRTLSKAQKVLNPINYPQIASIAKQDDTK